MLSIAGSTLPDERICSSLIMLIQRNPELHGYVVHKLFWALHDDVSQLSLVHVGIWCVGEYGSLLLLDAPASEDTLSEKTKVDETSIVELFKSVLRYHAITDVTKAYALNALTKLTTRFRSPNEIQKLNYMISSFNSSMVVELQQRATEYSALGQPQWSSLRSDILASMPAIDASKLRNRNSRVTENSMDLMGDDQFGSNSQSTPATPFDAPAPKPAAAAASLLDMDDIFGTGPAAPVAGVAPVSAPAISTTVDLLADIFSTGPSATPAPAPMSAPLGNDLLGLGFGGPVTTAPPPAPVAPVASPLLRAYEKNGLTVDLEVSKPNKDDPSLTYIQATIGNATAIPLQNFVFLAAFPKYIKLKMEPPSGNLVPPHNSGTVTQLVKIQNAMHGEVCA